jgi:hypothetical protein
LIEIYLKTTTDGVWVSKSDDQTGYILELISGKPSLKIRSNGASCSRIASLTIHDGQWHHVLAEVDRDKPQGITIYVDGKIANGPFSGEMLSEDASLGNTNDFWVGKGLSGNPFVGTIDFLRVCQGTLNDSDTTIEDLYEWQCNGPQHRDFLGKEIEDGKRDAGAIEQQKK